MVVSLWQFLLYCHWASVIVVAATTNPPDRDDKMRQDIKDFFKSQYAGKPEQPTAATRRWKNHREMFPYKPKSEDNDHASSDPTESPEASTCGCRSLQTDLYSCLDELKLCKNPGDNRNQSKNGTDDGRSEDSRSSGANADGSKGSELPCRTTGLSIDDTYLRRVTILIGRQLSANARHDSPAVVYLKFSTEGIAAMKRFVTGNSKDGPPAFRAILDAVENMVVDADYSKDAYTAEFHPSFFNFTSVELNCFVAVTIAAAVILVLMHTTQFSWRKMFAFFIMIAFVVSTGINYLYLIQEKTAEKEYDTLKGMSDKCINREAGFIGRMKNFFHGYTDQECREYYKSQRIDPSYKVTLAEAMMLTVSTFVFDPLVGLFARFDKIIQMVTNEHNFIAAPIIIVGFAILFIVICFVMCGYSFYTPVFSVSAPAQSPLQNLAQQLAGANEAVAGHGLPTIAAGSRAEDAEPIAIADSGSTALRYRGKTTPSLPCTHCSGSCGNAENRNSPSITPITINLHVPTSIQGISRNETAAALPGPSYSHKPENSPSSNASFNGLPVQQIGYEVLEANSDDKSDTNVSSPMPSISNLSSPSSYQEQSQSIQTKNPIEQDCKSPREAWNSDLGVPNDNKVPNEKVDLQEWQIVS